MLNIRQFNHNDSQLDSNPSFSLARIKIPSNLLGNIGEPLDHTQSELHFEESDEIGEAQELSILALDREYDGQQATETCRTLQDGHTDGHVGTTSAEPVAGPSGTSDREGVSGMREDIGHGTQEVEGV